MAANRRNYYRLLHVQPDAPADVIKAAFRALIRVHHPDTGGDHLVATLLNEAYGVLCNESKRAAYDAKHAVRPARARRDATRDVQHGAGAGAGVRGRGCAFCHFALPTIVRGGTRCLRCQGPLAPAVGAGDVSKSAERRGLPRVNKSDWGTMQVCWPCEPIDVRMRDLSLVGISIYSGNAVPVGTTLRIVAAAVDVVADLVSCRRVDKVFTIHARLVTAIFASPTGGFVSMAA
ncbi:MAG: J domain-containing protein [Phycisphaerae bacterium]|nr:J domain-containing protein [Gemmatimonadaceae bacterium]